MKNTIQGFFGGILAVLMIGIAYAAYTHFDQIEVGATIAPGLESSVNVATINGAISYGAKNVGPDFGNGVCGHGFRTTAEQNFDPALLSRCNSYIWETYNGTQLQEDASLNSTGMIIGKKPQDATPYPLDRLDVRSGGIGIDAWSDTSQAATYILFRQEGNPVWALTSDNKMFGTGQDLVLMKWKNGAWSQAQRWAY